MHLKQHFELPSFPEGVNLTTSKDTFNGFLLEGLGYNLLIAALSA